MAKFGGRKAVQKTWGQKRYSQYLKSIAWKRRKSEFSIFHADICTVCGKEGGNQLHHMSYDRMNYDGTEPDDDLTWLCRADHKLVHRAAEVGNYDLRTAVAVLAAIFEPVEMAQPDPGLQKRTRKQKLDDVNGFMEAMRNEG